MAFINENISECDKAQIDWKALRVYAPSSWTVDRERNAIFLQITPGRPFPDNRRPEYKLIWKGHPIAIYLDDPWEGHKGFSIYQVFSMKVPGAVKSDGSSILNALTEAFISYGSIFTSDEIKVRYSKEAIKELLGE